MTGTEWEPNRGEPSEITQLQKPDFLVSFAGRVGMPGPLAAALQDREAYDCFGPF
jgi:hypothetical protein